MTAHADPPAPFDLAGRLWTSKSPEASQTLPISQVPNLATGDQLVDQGRFPGDAVGALSAGGGVSARRDQSAAEGVVLQLRDLDRQVRARA